MLSMPLALGTTLATIPSARSYLRADAAQIAAWRDAPRRDGRAGFPDRPGVGRQSPARRPRWRRLTAGAPWPPDRLAPLFDLPGLQVLQPAKDGPPAAQAHFPLVDFMAEMGDFADTAALIANLDLVISVDTAVVHLAAALGTPVWMRIA